MANIVDWSTTAALNVLSSGTVGTGGINTAEGMARSDVNNAIRDLMARIKAWQTTGAFGVLVTVDNTVPRFDGIAGKIQTSGLIIDDSNNVSGIGTLAMTGAIAMVAAVPQVVFTDTDTGADSHITANSAVGGVDISADTNNEVANSTIRFLIDGSIIGTITPTGFNSTPIGVTTAAPGRYTTITYTTSLTLLAGTAPTAEGSMQWNTTTDAILVGDGAATKTFRANSWETISETAISAAASWATTGLSAWRMLRAYGWAIPVTDGVNAIVRTDANGGASYDAGASDYGLVGTKSIGGTSSGVGQTTTGFVLNNTNTIGNVAPEGIWFEITFHEFNQARRCFVKFTASWIDGSGVFCQQTIGGFRDDANARDAIQFIFSSGNIATGYITLEGVRG